MEDDHIKDIEYEIEYENSKHDDEGKEDDNAKQDDDYIEIGKMDVPDDFEEQINLLYSLIKQHEDKILELETQTSQY